MKIYVVLKDPQIKAKVLGAARVSTLNCNNGNMVEVEIKLDSYRSDGFLIPTDPSILKALGGPIPSEAMEHLRFVA